MTARQVNSRIREWMPAISLVTSLVSLAVVALGWTNGYAVLRYQVDRHEKLLSNGLNAEIRRVETESRDRDERLAETVHGHIEARAAHGGVG
jgi:hypothetical protein